MRDLGAVRRGGHSEAVAGNQRAFVWSNGRIRDLGTLGGRSTYPAASNDRGQIVGTSTTRGGQEHAFLWTLRRGA
jgi:probable HAF family extracellular repeat protein